MYDTNSPYAHILHTNHVPSESQLQEIRRYLVKPEERLQRLEAEIARMRAIVEGLESEHSKLKEFVDLHRALLSPIRRMAPELLQEMFVRCLPTTRNCVMDATEAPLLLIRICSNWRQIALSTPEVWSSLHISIPRKRSLEPTNSRMPYILQKAQDWLARSGTCPLSISLYIYEPHPSEFAPIIESLAPFIHRSRNIGFSVPREFLAHLGSRDVPFLEEIAIHLTPDQPNPSQFKAFSILKRTSLIRRVTLGGGTTKLEEAYLLPLNQLQALYLHCPCNLNEMLDLLKRCIDLRTFSLTTPFYIPFLHPGQLVILPQLRALTMCADDFTIPALMESLVVPRLRELTVDVQKTVVLGTQNRAVYSSLLSMITRSSCSLERLVFPHMHLNQDALAECLSLMPGLISLELNSLGLDRWEDEYVGKEEHIFGTVILRLLTPNAETPTTCLLPNLQKIAMHNYADLSDETILDFVHRRKQSIPAGIAPLTHVHVRRWDEIGDGAPSPDLMTLREDELRITVETLSRVGRRSFYSYDPRDGIFSPALQ